MSKNINMNSVVRYEEFERMIYMLSDEQQSILDSFGIIEYLNDYENSVGLMLQTGDYRGVQRLVDRYTADCSKIGMNVTIDYKTVLYKERYKQSLVNVLVRAVRKDDFDTVRDIIENKFADALSCSTSVKSATGLGCAIFQGALHIVKCFLENGMDVNATDTNDVSALIYAALANDTKIAVYLINNGAEVNMQVIQGLTPLMSAAGKGCFAVVKCLVEHNADLEICNENETTALMFASQGGDFDIVKYLVEHGAKIDALDDESHSALMQAMAKKHEDIVEYLVSKGARIDVLEQGESWLFYAAKGGHLCVVQYLLENNVDINISDGKKQTALMFAVLSGQSEVVRYLVEHGADVNRHDSQNRTALQIAEEQGYTEIAQYLQESVDSHANSAETSTGGMLGEIVDWFTSFNLEFGK